MTNKENNVVDLMKWKGSEKRHTEMRYLAKHRSEEFSNRFTDDPLDVHVCCLDAQAEGMLGYRKAVERSFNER